MSNQLNNLRKKVDAADKRILKNIAARFALTKKIGSIKAKHNLPVRDARREKELIAKNKKIAKELGIDTMLIEKIYKVILDAARQNHRREKKRR